MFSEPLPSEEPVYAERQREVQRWMGRCLLTSQNYERLLKAVLHASDVGLVARVGSDPSQWQPKWRFPQEAVRNQSLGQLVAKWFEVVVSADPARSVALEDEADIPSDVMAFKGSFSLQVDSDHFTEIKTGIELMVRERNELVHHFVERFDLWTPPGCEQALAHLQVLYGRMEQQYGQLRDWAMQMDKAREHMAQLLSSPAGKQLFITDAEKQPHQWLLLMALVNGAADDEGWVQLDTSVPLIRSQPVPCSPRQLGLKTWYQVLKRLPGFEAERRLDAEGRQKVWFRFHPPSAETVPAAPQSVGELNA